MICVHSRVYDADLHAFSGVSGIPGLVGADLDLGLFFVLAVMGVGVIGSLMGGWASANKFSLLGGIRVAAQLMAYELPFVLAAASVAMAASQAASADRPIFETECDEGKRDMQRRAAETGRFYEIARMR